MIAKIKRIMQGPDSSIDSLQDKVEELSAKVKELAEALKSLTYVVAQHNAAIMIQATESDRIVRMMTNGTATELPDIFPNDSKPN